MIQIILLILGTVYACRKPTLKQLTPEEYPDVPPENFREWHKLEMKSINMFLWATWGLLVIGTPLLFVLTQRFLGGAMGVFFYLFLFVVILAFSAIPGSKAAKLKQQFSIAWPTSTPPSKGFYNRACIRCVAESAFTKAQWLADLQEAIRRRPAYRAFAKQDKDFRKYWADPEFLAIVNSRDDERA